MMPREASRSDSVSKRGTTRRGGCEARTGAATWLSFSTCRAQAAGRGNANKVQGGAGKAQAEVEAEAKSGQRMCRSDELHRQAARSLATSLSTPNPSPHLSQP